MTKLRFRTGVLFLWDVWIIELNWIEYAAKRKKKIGIMVVVYQVWMCAHVWLYEPRSVYFYICFYDRLYNTVAPTSMCHIILTGHGVCLNVCSHFFGQSMCSRISVAQGYMYAIGIWLYIYNSTQTCWYKWLSSNAVRGNELFP